MRTTLTLEEGIETDRSLTILVSGKKITDITQLEGKQMKDLQGENGKLTVRMNATPVQALYDETTRTMNYTVQTKMGPLEGIRPATTPETPVIECLSELYDNSNFRDI